MIQVNGLYGHIQRNNAKVAILLATFLGLFLFTQFAFRLTIFWPMAKAVADVNGENTGLSAMVEKMIHHTNITIGGFATDGYFVVTGWISL